MALFWLSDEAWAAIEPHLPNNQPGARRVNDRRVILGILHVLKVGCRWCAARPSTGLRRRSTIGLTAGRTGLLAQAAGRAGDASAVTKSTAIDSTYVKAQRAAFGEKGGVQHRRSAARAAAGRSRSTHSPTSPAAPMR